VSITNSARWGLHQTWLVWKHQLYWNLLSR